LKKYIWSIVMIDRAVRYIRQRASVARPAAASLFVIVFTLMGGAPAGFAQSSQNTAAAKGKAMAAPAAAASRCRPAFVQRCSPTISATHGKWSSAPTVFCM
jgi:hypothetical protein